MDFPLEPYEVHRFRGAVLHAMGGESPDLFHQHSENGVIYRYPLIQYKVLSKRPTIVCLEEGADVIHHFFQNKTKPLRIGDKTFEPDIDRIFLKQHLLQVWQDPLYYGINHWLPFNPENHKEYLSLSGLVERTQFMERLLRNNIVHFAHSMGWDVEKEIEVMIRKIYPPKSVTYKGMHYKSYKIDFYANVSLPNHIGLGKAASTGFGVVYRKRIENINNDQ